MTHAVEPRRPSRRKGARSGASPARVQALNTIRLWRERKGFVQDIMVRTVDEAPLSPEDRAFATKLVCGVVSCVGTLEELLDSCLDSPDDARPNVRDALLISIYELIFLDKSPHAAVDQGVELVRSVAPRAAGLANAVLRRASRLRSAFPFGDPAVELPPFARSQGFPLWLAERLSDDLGGDAARSFMEASNEPAPLFVAVNAIKADDEEMFALLSEAGAGPEAVEVAGGRLAGCFRLTDRRALLDERVAQTLRAGELLVADAASQAVAAKVSRSARALRRACVAASEPFSLLEVGAGRATKTILLQSGAVRTFGRQCEDHVAIDDIGFKNDVLRERAATYGVAVSEALTGDAADLDASVGPRAFDLVFIDAPCTGLGTMRRHPEIRWRVRPESIEEAAALDVTLLRSAAAHLKPRGIIAYATCTVTTEENEGAVARFLRSAEGASFELVDALKTELMDGASSPDAHFLCLLEKCSVDSNAGGAS